METVSFDFIVIGSGIAGLRAASVLGEFGRTCVITKGAIRESATQYAQGGIAAALQQDDTPLLHLEDTLIAGDGLCDRNAVKILVEEGPSRVRELIQMGAGFDRVLGELDFASEGSHQKRRILHAKDATGREIERALGHFLTKQDAVVFFEHASVVQLIVVDGVCGGCLVVIDGQRLCFLAKSVLIASGGYGQVYSATTNPPVATGDGIFLAYDQGAEVQDMEFVQFHPTALMVGDKKPISIFLISEALRGEGAVLRDCHGVRFMDKYHPLAELAPRDIVARAIVTEMNKEGAPCVYLDLGALKVDIPKRFPTIYTRCLELGIDITQSFIPVTPAAHYCMGGIKTDFEGRTTISGLYAAGEVAALGVHGANRLASNSLLDGLVFGYRAANAMGASYRGERLSEAHCFAVIQKENDMDAGRMAEIIHLQSLIKATMSDCVGIEKTGDSLREALKRFASYAWVLEVPSFRRPMMECKSLLKLAELTALFSLKREESRGGHFRKDFPYHDDQNWQVHLRKSKTTDFRAVPA